MGVMISINPPYTHMIISGYKPFEFRKKIINSLVPGMTIYIYETKNRKGIGKVVGECTVDKIFDFNRLSTSYILTKNNNGQDLCCKNNEKICTHKIDRQNELCCLCYTEREDCYEVLTQYALKNIISLKKR